MANPNKPFKGEFGLDDEATGAENTSLNDKYVSMTAATELTTIDLGPFLSPAAVAQPRVSSGVTVNISLQKLSAVQILGLFNHWNDQDLMEAMYHAEDGTLGTGTVTNMAVTVQFYLVNAPSIPMVQDEIYTYETGDVLAQGFKLDDGATPVTVGTLLST